MGVESLLSFILKEWKIHINDDKLLENICDFFGVEFSILYIINFGSLLDFESNIEFNYYISKDILKTKKGLTSIYFSGAIKESFESRTILNIGDYLEYKNAVKEWKEAGVKSLLTVPIIQDDDIYGCIQLACLKSKNKFSRRDEFYLSLVADVMALMISNEIKNNKIMLHSSAEELHVKISSSLKDMTKVSIEEWLKINIKYVLEYTNAYISGFIMPSDNIYCIVDRDDKFTVCQNEFNEKFEKWITGTLFKKRVKNPITLEEAMRLYGVNLSEQVNVLGLKDGIYVPVEYNGKIVAFFSYGFKERIRNIHYHKILLKNVGMHMFIAVLSFRRLSNIARVLTQHEEQFIKSLMKIAEARDTYTRGHSERVAYYARIIGETIGLSEEKVNLVYTAGLLHDIGKIGIPDSILLKPGKLSKHEFEIMKYHPVFSYEMVKDVAPLKKVATCIRHHHERCDGSGYPDGLKCKNIECCARVLAIADVFDALTSNRTYREKSKYTPFEAIKVMEGMPLDMDILEMTKESLIEHFKYENNHENLIQLKDIERERVSIFFKDFLTGTDRLSVFREFVNSKIKEGRPFLLFVIDIKNLGYINYKYGIDYGNRLIEYLAEELLRNPAVFKVMRDGADSFVFLSDNDYIDRIFSFIEMLDDKARMRFFSKVGEYESGLLYKTFVSFPQDGDNFENLLYRLRLRLKYIRRYHNSHLTS